MSDGIVAEGLRKRYGRLQALDGLYLRVAPGEILGLIGPNGAGKTTTLRILAGLLAPDEGSVTIDGIDLLRSGRAARHFIGYMPEDFGLYNDLRVWEYLDFYADCFGIPGKERPALIGDLLELVDLGHKRDDNVDGLSRGMRQRLCLAHALIHDPAVLILDEPASGLDPRARVELREILRTLAGQGKSIVISSHILSELAEVCTTLARPVPRSIRFWHRPGGRRAWWRSEWTATICSSTFQGTKLPHRACSPPSWPTAIRLSTLASGRPLWRRCS
jgi:ABC-2 type transport system ATP-binding protein